MGGDRARRLDAAATAANRAASVSGVDDLAEASLSYNSLKGWDEAGRLDHLLALSRAVGRTRAFGDLWSYMLRRRGRDRHRGRIRPEAVGHRGARPDRARGRRARHHRGRRRTARRGSILVEQRHPARRRPARTDHLVSAWMSGRVVGALVAGAAALVLSACAATPSGIPTGNRIPLTQRQPGGSRIPDRGRRLRERRLDVRRRHPRADRGLLRPA